VLRKLARMLENQPRNVYFFAQDKNLFIIGWVWVVLYLPILMSIYALLKLRHRILYEFNFYIMG
jgi:hypothetical protein